jgi:hypothetical protein
MLGVAALAAFLVLAWVAFGTDLFGGDEDPGRDGTPTAGGASQEESPSPSPSPSESESASAEEQAAEMRQFVEDYLATVTSDPAATWERLTPEFQQASGGFGGYRGFWRTIASAQPSNIQADPEAMTVSYDVAYERTDGTTMPDSVTLELVEDGDQLLIAGES